jgi:hypothetical protein
LIALLSALFARRWVETRRTLGVDRRTLGVDRWTLGGHSAWIRLLISVAHITLWILVKRVADFR